MKAARALGRIEEIEPLVEHDPQRRDSRRRDAARDADRIVAAVARHIDVRVGREGRAVALIVEAPDRAGVAVLEFRPARDRLAVGEIGDRIDAVDREPGVAVDHDALGGRGARGPAAVAASAARGQAAGAAQSTCRFLARRDAVIVPARCRPDSGPVRRHYAACRVQRVKRSTLPMESMRAPSDACSSCFPCRCRALAGRPARRPQSPRTLCSNEILDAGHRFFGGVRAGWRAWSRTRVLPLGPAERLRPRPGRRRRLHRRAAFRRRHALHQECRRPAGLLAGPVARLGRRRRRRPDHDAGLQPARHARRSISASPASTARPIWSAASA